MLTLGSSSTALLKQLVELAEQTFPDRLPTQLDNINEREIAYRSGRCSMIRWFREQYEAIERRHKEPPT